ncbi:MAG: hypothetical protein AAFW84_23875 [Cyanobacteria bacterium J06635_15]
MQKSGWDARRRNRNMGTAKSGHGQDNRLTIPESWADNRRFYERLHNPVALARDINGHRLTFLIEATHADFCHACTPQDIERVLELIPLDHLAPIRLIVLRQPKRKELILNPVWGRLQYWADIGPYSGPAIHLEAQPVNATYRWPKSLTPDQTLELKRLEQEGHKIHSDRRYHHITSNFEALRYTQLYRTTPHEIGHYVDYLESVTIPAGEDVVERQQLDNLYASKPTKDKEDFANRYATEFLTQQVQIGRLPFDRLLDPKQLKKSGLDPVWFSHLHAVDPL